MKRERTRFGRIARAIVNEERSIDWDVIGRMNFVAYLWRVFQSGELIVREIKDFETVETP